MGPTEGGPHEGGGTDGGGTEKGATDGGPSSRSGLSVGLMDGSMAEMEGSVTCWRVFMSGMLSNRFELGNIGSTVVDMCSDLTDSNNNIGQHNVNMTQMIG